MKRPVTMPWVEMAVAFWDEFVSSGTAASSLSNWS
jgi:hypothetical protein